MTLENKIDPSAKIAPTAIVDDSYIGRNSNVWHYSNLYGCEVGDDCTIGSYVEMQKDSKIGDGVTISSHSFICSLVEVADNVFIGHGVKTINDLNPPSRKRTGSTSEWKPTYIGEGAVVGSNATIFPVNIGKYAKIGAGSVVTKNVPDYAVVVGNPARIVKYSEPNES